MTHLRKMMLDELQRRNYAETTIDCYIRAVEDFSRRFRLPPDRLGPRHIREYQAELFQKQKLATSTVRQRLAALRFFYIKTLKKAWSVEDTPYPRKTRRLPTILSQEEVARLIDEARPPLHRTLCRTAWPQLAIARSLHSIPIGPASAAGRLDSNGFIESAPEHRARAQVYSEKRASDKTLTFVASDYDLIARFLLTLYRWIGIIPIERR